MKQKKIKGWCSVDGASFPCCGSLEILHKKGKSIYASWKMQGEDETILASVSREYFTDKDQIEESDVMPLILNNITNYRLGRKRIFSRVEIVDK